MSVEIVKTEIEGHRYELTLFGAKVGQRVFLRLAKCLGPAAVAIAGKGSAGVPEAIQGVLSGISEADLDFLNESFAGSCKLIMTVQTKAGPQDLPQPLATHYDHHFARRYPAWFAWFAWCVKENYASFFDGKGIAALSGILPDLSGSKSPKGSTGSLNESSQAPATTSEDGK